MPRRIYRIIFHSILSNRKNPYGLFSFSSSPLCSCLQHLKQGGLASDCQVRALENPVIRDFRDIHTIWNFAPLRVVGYFTFALNYHWHQLAVQGYHVFNIMIHFLAGFTVLCLVRGLLQTPTVRGGVAMVTEKWLPLLAALIFLLHPLQTQAVTYIVQRLASMAGLFYIGTLACYVRARTVQKAQGRWGWSAAAPFRGTSPGKPSTSRACRFQ